MPEVFPRLTESGKSGEGISNLSRVSPKVFSFFLESHQNGTETVGCLGHPHGQNTGKVCSLKGVSLNLGSSPGKMDTDTCPMKPPHLNKIRCQEGVCKQGFDCHGLSQTVSLSAGHHSGR